MNIQFLAGQQLGQYKLNQLLGAGGMSVVYQAYQSSLKRNVAIKMLLPDLAGQGEYTTRFNHEAQIAAKLQHPNIVPIFDYGILNDSSYIVMRLLTGGTLTERIRRQQSNNQGRFMLSGIAELLKQLASALDYAHRLGVIHRDIKPSNIMFDEHGAAILVDFGIATILDTSTQDLNHLDKLMGTYAFMAPEIWHEKQITHYVDQYALGLLMYSLITGFPAFDIQSNGLSALMHKHLYEMPTPVHQLCEDSTVLISQVIERAIAKRPEARYPTVTAFAEAFTSAVQGIAHKETFVFDKLRSLKRAALNNSPKGKTGPLDTFNDDTLPARTRPNEPKSEDWLNMATRVSMPAPRVTRTSLSAPARDSAKIFISYRRSDSADITGRIYDRLVAHFGEDIIFRDLNSMPLGTNFKKYIENIVQKCVVELVVMGQQWVNITDALGQRRLENPDDFVRVEIEAALNADIPVIPLLVQDTVMPRKEHLPSNLRELVYCNGASVRADPDFHNDMDRLIKSLETLLKANERYR
ncbi:MAG: protein kinase [Chloroflexota bacterium]